MLREWIGETLREGYCEGYCERIFSQAEGGEGNEGALQECEDGSGACLKRKLAMEVHERKEDEPQSVTGPTIALIPLASHRESSVAIPSTLAYSSVFLCHLGVAILHSLSSLIESNSSISHKLASTRGFASSSSGRTTPRDTRGVGRTWRMSTRARMSVGPSVKERWERAKQRWKRGMKSGGGERKVDEVPRCGGEVGEDLIVVERFRVESEEEGGERRGGGEEGGEEGGRLPVMVEAEVGESEGK